MVYNLSLKYLRNEEDAKDCTQEVFVKIYNKLSDFKGQSQLKTWIYRIAVNKAMDKIRSNKIRNSLTWIGLAKTDLEIFDFNTPGLALEQKEAIDNIMAAIDDLPKKQKSVIILKRLENLSTAEISEIMKLSEKSVESLIYRAKKTLKESLNLGK